MTWREPPTADFDDDATFRWPFWQVDVDEADLFGDPHERFNTAPMFIQDPDAPQYITPPNPIRSIAIRLLRQLDVGLESDPFGGNHSASAPRPWNYQTRE